MVYPHCRRRRTEPPLQVTCTENWENMDVWFLRYVSKQTGDKQTNRHTDRHTDMLIAILRTSTVSEVICVNKLEQDSNR